MSGNELKQRLAAILAADVAGYSRLMANDDRATVAALDDARGVFKSQIESNQGRVIDMAGDSVLAVFETAIGAVSASHAIQKALNEASSEVPEDRRMRFRIGIHLGDIIEKADGSVYGDGVNIAARLEGLAEAGGITISESIRTAVKGKVDATFEDRGVQTVKNIAEPVRAYRLVLDGALPAEEQQPTSSPHAGKPAIAVLPFNNMSGEASQEGFADGITEDIITALSRSHAFDVTARNSTFAYKGTSPDIREVARALGVGYVLEGSVRQGGGRARITVQLIDAESGNHVWADRYDRQLDDEFAIQDEIAQRISSILTERVWQDVARNIGQKQLEDYSAYDHAFRGVELLHRLEPDSTAHAVVCFEAGLALDPDLFYGHLGLGFCYVMSGFWWGDPDDAMLEHAHQHALRLGKIAPENASTYRLLSRVYNAMGRREESWDCVQRALRIDPNDGDIIGNRGVYHLFNGEYSEAVEWIDKVLDLHADTPHTVDIMRYWKAFTLFAAGDYATAAALLGTLSGLDFIKAELLAACHVRLAQTDKAQVRAAEVLLAYPEFRLAHVRLWKNFRSVADQQNLLSALREAGLPE